MTLDQLKQQFISTVTTANIDYDHDGGHAYSMLNHPLAMYPEDYMEKFGLSREDAEEMDSFTHGWLYNNDDCPPCELNGGCGCNVDNDSNNNTNQED
jgi:hypothetical protein